MNDLIVIEALQPAEVFTPGGVDRVLQSVFDKVRAMPLDPSTDTGRDEIKSLAYKIARSKTALDDMGKEFVGDLKRAVREVDADRKTIRDRLDALRDEVRQPVTDWEAAEEARINAHVAALDQLKALGEFSGELGLQELGRRQDQLSEARRRDWEEFGERFSQLSQRAHDALVAQMAVAKRREAERAELEELRRLKAERDARDAEELRAKLQREREERIAEEAATKAALEAQERAGAFAREAQEQVELAQRRQREAEEAAQLAVEQERERVARQEAETAKADAERVANLEHRRAINQQVLADLMRAGASRDTAKKIVIAIAAGAVAHTSIKY